MNLKRYSIAGLTALVFFMLALPAAGGMKASCVEGNGRLGDEQRQLPPFSKIRINGTFDVHVHCGMDQEIRIRAETNLLPRIRTRVEGETLWVDTDASICAKKNIRIRVALPRLDHFAADGAIDAVIARIHSDHFVLELGGSGNATLSGRTERFEARMTGAGDLFAKDLLSGHTAVSILGTGQAAVHAARRLDATIAGVGDITVHGNPAQIAENITGLGEVLRP